MGMMLLVAKEAAIQIYLAFPRSIAGSRSHDFGILGSLWMVVPLLSLRDETQLVRVFAFSILEV